MTGYLTYTAARAQIDDLHRVAADERLAAEVSGRRRRQPWFSVHRGRATTRPAQHTDPENASRALSGWRPVARH